MKTYKAVIRPVSPFVTPLQADTIFGHFVWMIKYMYGDKDADEFVDKLRKKEKKFSVSSGFKHNMLPIPLIPLDIEEENEILDLFKKIASTRNCKRKAEYYFQRYEKYVKTKSCWIDSEKLFNIVKQQGNIAKIIKPTLEVQEKEIENFISKIDNKNEIQKEEQLTKEIETEYVMRNTINRLSGCTCIGGLFETENIFYSTNTLFDIYIKTDIFDIEKIKLILSFMGKHGYGADATVGKGQFELQSISEINFPETKDYTHFLSLATYIPDINEAELSDSYYSIFIKRGKLGGEYSGGISNIEKSFFKIPLIMIKEGALIKVKEKKEIYGILVENVNKYDQRIIHSGISFGIGLKM